MYSSTIDSIAPIQNLLQKLVDLEWTVLEGHEHQGEDEEYLDSPKNNNNDSTNKNKNTTNNTQEREKENETYNIFRLHRV